MKIEFIDLFKDTLWFRFDILNPVHCIRFWGQYLFYFPPLLIVILLFPQLKTKTLVYKHLKLILLSLFLWIIYWVTPYSAADFPAIPSILLIHNFRYSFIAYVWTMITCFVVLSDDS